MTVSAIERRRNWRSNWLATLAEFASREMQQRWIQQTDNPGPHWSFGEFTCCYFDDLGLTRRDGGYVQHLERGFISSEEYEAIREFHEALEKYKPPRGYEDSLAVLQDSKWEQVVQIANRARHRIAELLTDPAELSALSSDDSKILTHGYFLPPKKSD